jgi:hypothetical protein
MHKSIIWATMVVIQFPFYVSDTSEKHENNISEKHENNRNQTKKEQEK